MNRNEIKVLNSGYVKLIEAYGTGLDGRVGEKVEGSDEFNSEDDYEVGIIEAARQSTQASFRGWTTWYCNTCGSLFEFKQDHVKEDGSECEAKSWANDEKLLGFLHNNHHTTPFEFAGLIIEVKLPIFVVREWHRHRTQSYNEMSARYAPLPDENYIPTKERLFMSQEKNKQAQAAEGSRILCNTEAEVWLAGLEEFYKDAERLYQWGLENGIPKEVARIVLPVGRYTKMRASANLLNWLKFCGLRSTKSNPNAQYEIRMFADSLELILAEVFPKTFELFDRLRSREEN